MRRLGIVGVMLLALAPATARAQSAPESGVYVGGHAGAAWEHVDYVEPDEPQFAIEGDATGVVGGGLVGYSRQAGPLVYGAEADFGGARLRFESNDPEGNDYTAVHLDWNAHVRARLGRAWGQAMFFVAGGVVLARVAVDDRDPGFGEEHALHTGWTFGGGVERSLSRRIGLRAEYLRDDYGSKRYSIDSPAESAYFPLYLAEAAPTAHTFRGAIVLRF